ncbi:MAG: lysostaphin resistance A-like protein [Candidatus Hodarchaeota archaeon]
MAIDDPDSYEMSEYTGIDIFTPGSIVEREINGDQMFHVLVLTGAAFGATVLFTLLMMIPLMAAGLIVVNLNTLEIYFHPLAFLIITCAEIGFIIPPLRYIRNNGLSNRSLGLFSSGVVRDIILGLIVGGAMLLSNVFVTWFTYFITDTPITGDESFFLVTNEVELVLWVIAMFAVVGFSEELLFRGFLQRRMEIFFRDRRGSPNLWALIITSIIFSAMHLDIAGLLTRFVLGLFLGFLAQKRNYSLLGPTVAHGFNNAAVVVLAFLGV